MKKKKIFKILIVNSNLDHLQFCIEYLQSRNFDVTTCGYIEDLSIKLSEQKFDLVVLGSKFLPKSAPSDGECELFNGFDELSVGIEMGIPELENLKIPFTVPYIILDNIGEDTIIKALGKVNFFPHLVTVHFGSFATPEVFYKRVKEAIKS